MKARRSTSQGHLQLHTACRTPQSHLNIKMRHPISLSTFPDPPSQTSSQFEDLPIDAPSPLKVIVVGAGISGITAAVLLPIKVPGLELVIYERESDLVPLPSCSMSRSC